MNYDVLCNNILDIPTSMRFAAVYHMSGEKLAGGYKQGKSPLTNDQKFQESIVHALVIRNSHKMLEVYFGQEKYSMLNFEKAKAFVFPLEKDIVLLASTEPDGDHQLLIQRVFFYKKKTEILYEK